MGVRADNLNSIGHLNMSCSLEDVREFLLALKIALSRRTLSFVERLKNLDDMAELGILPSDISGIIKNLKVSDYWDGPLQDDKGREKTWWVFGPQYEGETLYVKVCIVTNASGKQVVECLSLHKATSIQAYPFSEPIERGQ